MITFWFVTNQPCLRTRHFKYRSLTGPKQHLWPRLWRLHAAEHCSGVEFSALIVWRLSLSLIVGLSSGSLNENWGLWVTRAQLLCCGLLAGQCKERRQTERLNKLSGNNTNTQPVAKQSSRYLLILDDSRCRYVCGYVCTWLPTTEHTWDVVN